MAEESRLETSEITVRAFGGNDSFTVAVAGRVTVDSSPGLRSVLLGLTRVHANRSLVIDASAVSYLDMAGIATLLEALKSAHEHSVELRVAGITGQARALAEVAQLGTIFREWGAEVQFC